ncbi:uncharacterized protein LOC126901994 isoform X1 [Daktulosphaira vitifoliae]|uniref:uncharacterized protein LOC126901994 isoform X1 n=1 Tax=Daktulosphaira vitifoliae TaxID=58002 RepID=UPI0021A9DA51|nr:uncharacterized protein LOC126901994 isoform X1 [Daktulosphaira vitifoliae]
MNYFSIIHSMLLNITISNAIIVPKTNELFTNIEYQTFVTNDDLNELIRGYPAFLQLTLRENKYYTGSDASLCPLPYDENTLLDDPDVEKLQYFDPRKCEKPWTWTQQNQIIVPVQKEFTINKRLGKLIFRNNNLEIIQSYTHYLNTMESVGITLVDRFCLFLMEVMDRIDDFSHASIRLPLSNRTVFYLVGNLSIYYFKKLLRHIYDTFRKYFISTLPLDCISNVLKEIYPNDELNNFDGIPILKNNIEKYKAQLLECRKLTHLKRNYAILINDDLWEHDIISKDIPDNQDLITLYEDNVEKIATLFNVARVSLFVYL